MNAAELDVLGHFVMSSVAVQDAPPDSTSNNTLKNCNRGMVLLKGFRSTFLPTFLPFLPNPAIPFRIRDFDWLDIFQPPDFLCALPC